MLCPACQARWCPHLQTKESKSFWKAMMKVHEKLTDINQIKAHNQIKETKLKVRARPLPAGCCWTGPCCCGGCAQRPHREQAV